MKDYSKKSLAGYKLEDIYSMPYFDVIEKAIKLLNPNLDSVLKLENETEFFLNNMGKSCLIKNFLRYVLKGELKDIFDTLKKKEKEEEIKMFHLYAEYIEKNNYYFEPLLRKFRYQRRKVATLLILEYHKIGNLKAFLTGDFKMELKEETEELTKGLAIIEKYKENWEEILKKKFLEELEREE